MVKLLESESDIPFSGIVVIDFFADWCGPCRRIAPKFEELSKIYPSVAFLKVDVDESEKLVEKFDVHVMPTFIFLHNGSQVKKIEGADLRSIYETLEVLKDLS